MSRKALVVPLALALAACASSPQPAGSNAASRPAPTSSGAGPAPLTSGAETVPISYGTGPASGNATSAPAATRPSATAAGWAVSIIGTPFALAFKTVVCGASLVVAAPIAGILALGADSSEGYQALGDGIAQNCGPPYVVSPYAAS
jgi:hypothetical protein